MVKFRFIYLSLFLLLVSLNSVHVYAHNDSVAYKSGQAAFRKLCSSCHSAHQEIYGPMLGSISKKRTESWLIPFIQNSQAVIKSGDPYAVALFKKYEYQIMPPFKELSASDIKDILYYLQLESVQPTEYFNDTAIPFTNDKSILAGKQHFLEHCSMCHFIHKESYFAPALGSVTKRHSREWLIAFIQNSQKKIAGDDAYAVDLFNAFDQHVMTNMDFLPVEEINTILNYIEFASTVYVAYEGKINSTNTKHASKQLKELSTDYNMRTIIAFTLIALLLAFTLRLIIFYMQVHVYLKKNTK